MTHESGKSRARNFAAVFVPAALLFLLIEAGRWIAYAGLPEEGVYRFTSRGWGAIADGLVNILGVTALTLLALLVARQTRPAIRWAVRVTLFALVYSGLTLMQATTEVAAVVGNDEVSFVRIFPFKAESYPRAEIRSVTLREKKMSIQPIVETDWGIIRPASAWTFDAAARRELERFADALNR